MADSPINVSVTGITGGHADNIQVIGINQVTGPDPLRDILARTKDEVEDMTAGMIRVSAVDVVVKKLSSGQPWVTITGNAGDGKTTLGYLVLGEFLQKGVVVSTLDKPDEYVQIARMKEDKVIMFDDRFGAFLADHQLIKSWHDVIQKLSRVIERVNANTKVIFISRKNVVNESKVYLGRLTDTIFDRERVVDLSKGKLTDERRKIMDYHLGLENVTIQHDIKTKVCNMEVAHGFPHCCKMFSKLKSKRYNVPIEDFFESPLKFLDMTTKVLYNETCKNLFQLMIKNDGKLDIYAIGDETERHDLFKVEKEQEGSYITVWRNGICQFAHPSVYESVLNVINDIDPLFCVRYATLSVIRQKMIIPTSDEEDRSRSACYVIVKPIPAVLKALAGRFREEILKGDYSVFKDRLCQSREFCEALVSCCVTTDKKENCSKRFINQPGEDDKMLRRSHAGRGMSNKDTMLWTAFSSGNIVAVCVLMREGASIQDVHDGYGRTPLHYLCREKNSTADGVAHLVGIDSIRMIIKEGGGDVNACDRYGRTPLHYLLKHQTIHAEAIKFMIRDMESDPNLVDINGCTPVHYFCRHEDVSVDLLQLMITVGGKVNQPDVYGSTPLHCLCRQRNISTDLLKLMITEGRGDLNLCEQNKSTPLHYLCANSSLQLDTVYLVIKEGKGDFNKGDEHGTTPLHYLCKTEKVELDVVLQIVNTANGDINKQDDNGITPLHVLCKGSLPIENILTLINQGDKADNYGNTPLHYLCRRRGIKAEVLQQQLKQIPKTDMMKENVCGYTPLDYLTDQDNSLPWTDGMIARSAADLVLCRLKLGDDRTVVIDNSLPWTDGMIARSAADLVLCRLKLGDDRTVVIDNSLPWTDGMIARSAADLVLCRLKLGDDRTVVIGRAMILNSERVHKKLQVEDFGRVLTNLEQSGDRKRPCRFSRFRGTCSSPVPVPPSPSPLTTPPSYWETSSTLTRRGRGGLPMLQMGLKLGRRNMDEGWFVSRLPHTVCVSVWNFCLHHRDCLCIQVLRRDQEDRRIHQVGECVSLSLPTPDVELTFTFGLVLDVGRGRVGVIDVERGQLLCKVDLQIKEEVSPMFYVNPGNNCTTRMRLVSGREICATDRKIHLIQQALSD